ncbi:MAG: pseudoazurin [Gammaproteobacteria bacterium]|nr:pseudoazurin [Gammaproteobacteria bacterium]|tara:strand:- start:525 stop:977 length:453 start_codon:yes stop_codon:yes gene_type:complete
MEKIMIKYLLIFPLFMVQFDLQGANHVVKMLNQGSGGVMVFEPAVLKVAVGDSVTFQSTDAAHNSASLPGMIPENAMSWNGQLSRDITVTLTQPGVYAYQCTPHSMMAMVGVIQVGDDASNLETVKTKAQMVKSSFVMNQTRLDDYLAKL